MKKFIGYLAIAFSIAGCASSKTMAYTYTGSQISSKFHSLQSIIIPYEYENGMILDKNAKVYKINKKECVIVAILNNESHFGGYEDLIYFSNKKMQSGYTRNFFSVFLDKDAEKKSKKIKYGEFMNDLDTQNELYNDFNNYLKQMNKKTLKECS